MLLYAKHNVKTLKKPILHESIKHLAIVGGNATNVKTQEKGMWLRQIEFRVDGNKNDNFSF